MSDHFPLIADANVLIDYLEADRSILALLGRHAGPVYVATPVLDKVDQLTAGDCGRLGLVVVEPTLGELLEAGQRRAGLAFDDTVCVIMARDNHWQCVTNDKALRRACTGEGVDVVWGLEVMLLLVKRGALSAEEACVVATKVQAINPFFITTKIVTELQVRARQVLGRTKRPKGD